MSAGRLGLMGVFEDSPILVTGATGHTGRRVARRLLEKGARVRCLLHTLEHRSRLPEHEQLEVVFGSAASEDDLARALEGVRAVLHLAHIRYAPALIRALEQAGDWRPEAGRGSAERGEENAECGMMNDEQKSSKGRSAAASDARGTDSGRRSSCSSSSTHHLSFPPTGPSLQPPGSPLRTPHSALRTSIRLVALSSTRLFSRFPSETQEAVRAGESAIMSAPPFVRWTILRSAMIFGGPDDNNLTRVAAAVKRWRVFPVFGSGRNLVQPVFVWDLVEALAACLERPETEGRCYTIAGAEATTYREMVCAAAKACGARPPIFLPLPRRPSLWAARALQWVWPGAPINPEMIERFGEDKAFDILDARRDLGFRPTPLREALERKFRGEV